MSKIGEPTRVTHAICVDCALQERLDPAVYEYHICDGCGLVVDALAVLIDFRVELGHLKGPLRFCVDCSLGGLAADWTHDLEAHLVAPLLE